MALSSEKNTKRLISSHVMLRKLYLSITVCCMLGVALHLKCVGKEEETTLPAEKKNLIIYSYKTSHKSENYPLQGDYGYMIFNEGSEENPKARFELYLNEASGSFC